MGRCAVAGKVTHNKAPGPCSGDTTFVRLCGVDLVGAGLGQSQVPRSNIARTAITPYKMDSCLDGAFRVVSAGESTSFVGESVGLSEIIDGAWGAEVGAVAKSGVA